MNLKSDFRFLVFARAGALLLTVLATSLASAADHRTYSLRVGEQKVIPFENGQRYAPSGHAIRVTRVHLDGHESLLVKADQSGRATLLVWRKEAEPETVAFQILPQSSPLPTEADQRTVFLNSLEDARVQSSPGLPGRGENVILQGEIKTKSEGRRIRTFVSANGDRVADRTYPSPALFRDCLRDLRNELVDRKLPDVKVEFSEGERWIEVTGFVKSESHIDTLTSQLADVCPWARIQIDANAGRLDLIRLKVVLIENYQTEDTLLGMNSGFRGESQLAVSAGKFASSFGVVSSLKALENRGKIRILSQPEIVLRTPGEAELFSGGEIPIETNSHFDSQVFWKNFGLALKVKSLFATTKKVRLDLSAEVSQVDRSLSTDKNPGLQSNRLKTEVEANFSEPLLLSGLYKTSTASTESGIPFLGRLPFFNLLFTESGTSHQHTELLAILIPYRDVPKLSREKVYGLAHTR